MRYTMVVLGYGFGADAESKVATTVAIEADSEKEAILEAAKIIAHIKKYNPDINYEYFIKRLPKGILL